MINHIPLPDWPSFTAAAENKFANSLGKQPQAPTSDSSGRTYSPSSPAIEFQNPHEDIMREQNTRADERLVKRGLVKPGLLSTDVFVV